MAFSGVQDGLNRAWYTQFLGLTVGWPPAMHRLQQRCMHTGEGASPDSRPVAGQEQRLRPPEACTGGRNLFPMFKIQGRQHSL